PHQTAKPPVKAQTRQHNRGNFGLDDDSGTVIPGLPSQITTRLFQFMPRRLLLPLLKNQHPGLRRDRSAS
ncbi:MAG: hypothetical protein ACLPYO_00355, partial [Mycobacterium sp.]